MIMAAYEINDPFDCHPSLIDFENIPPEQCIGWDEETIDCFESIYHGINTTEEDQYEIVKIARNLNPEIKIYRMKPNPTAFKLDAELLLL